MKKVFPPSEIAHLWANKIQDEATTSGRNFYFESDTIYSYGRHFPIACHYNGIVLMTLATYSNTTAKHIYNVRGAISHKTVLYCYEPVEAKCGNHNGNLQFWINNIKQQFPKLAVATKPEIYKEKIEREIAQLNAYMAFFKDAKLTKEQKAVLKLAASPDIKNIARKQSEKEIAANKLRNKRIKEAEIKMLEYWQNNVSWEDQDSEVKRLASGQYNWKDTYLRLTTDGKNIETSKGIKIPIDIAQRVYKQYLTKVSEGGCIGDCGNWKVLDYTVTQATSEAFIIGCHNIKADEIKRIADLMKW